MALRHGHIQVTFDVRAWAFEGCVAGWATQASPDSGLCPLFTKGRAVRFRAQYVPHAIPSPAQGFPLPASWMLWSQEEGKGLRRPESGSLAVPCCPWEPNIPPSLCFLSMVQTCQGSRQVKASSFSFGEATGSV